MSSTHSNLEEAEAFVASEAGWRRRLGRNSAKKYSTKFQKSIVLLCNEVKF
jgi:hypothetical protein